MHFNTAQEVEDFATEAAQDTYRRHIEQGHDINPFSTEGARMEWKRGYEGRLSKPWENERMLAFSTIYQRGKAMRKLIDNLGK